MSAALAYQHEQIASEPSQRTGVYCMSYRDGGSGRHTGGRESYGEDLRIALSALLLEREPATILAEAGH
jgi:hypothetical protein